MNLGYLARIGAMRDTLIAIQASYAIDPPLTNHLLLRPSSHPPLGGTLEYMIIPSGFARPP